MNRKNREGRASTHSMGESRDDAENADAGMHPLQEGETVDPPQGEGVQPPERMEAGAEGEGPDTHEQDSTGET